MNSRMLRSLRPVLAITWAVAFALLFSACNRYEEPVTGVERSDLTVGERIVDEGAKWGLGDFSAAVDTSDLQERLNGEGPYTVFAPNLGTIEDVELESLIENGDPLLEEILRLHVVEGQAIEASEIQDGQTVSSLGGELTFGVPDDTTVTVNEVEIKIRSIQCTNGVIHTIDRVLLSNQSLNTRIRLSRFLTDLEGVLGQSGLASGLPDGVTLFAPLNGSFGTIETETLFADPSTLDEILRHHVVDGTVTGEDLTDGATFTALDGTELNVQVNQVIEEEDGMTDTTTVTTVNEQPVRLRDQISSNGRLHAIGGVLLDNQPISQRVRLSTRHQDLEDALELTGLDGDLSGEGPFTVFAPTTRAFAALPAGVGEALLQDENRDLLAKILRHHVIPNQELRAADILGQDGAEIQTLQGETVEVSVGGDDNDVVSIDGIEVANTNFLASNGVFHSFEDGVLVPSELDVVQAGVVNGLTELGEATSVVGIRNTLQDENSTYTVLGPVDEAFESFLEAQGVSSYQELSSSQQDELERILKYHVIPRDIPLNTIRDGQEEETLEGSTVTFTVGNNVSVNGVEIQTADVEATNGRAHVIGEILQPPSNGGN